jgi:hypothetical protein
MPPLTKGRQDDSQRGLGLLQHLAVQFFYTFAVVTRTNIIWIQWLKSFVCMGWESEELRPEAT